MDGFQAAAASGPVCGESDFDERSNPPPRKDQHHNGVYGGWDESDLPPLEPPAKKTLPIVSTSRR